MCCLNFRLNCQEFFQYSFAFSYFYCTWAKATMNTILTHLNRWYPHSDSCRFLLRFALFNIWIAFEHTIYISMWPWETSPCIFLIIFLGLWAILWKHTYFYMIRRHKMVTCVISIFLCMADNQIFMNVERAYSISTLIFKRDRSIIVNA